MTTARTDRRARAIVVLVTALAAVLSACTGVPTTSAPETIQPIQLDDRDAARPIVPAKGSDPRRIVQDFLTANAVDAVRHTSARAFLTPAAQAKWSDATATIIDGEIVGTFQPGKPGRVSGRVVGTLSAAGIYTPSLQGTGSGGDVVQFPYRVVADNKGEYRIAGLPSGLLLTVDQFQQYYKQRPVYFYDLADRYLVPDPRWSALTGDQLDEWLVNEIVSGPRAELRNAVNADTLPQRANTRRLNITQGSPTEVEIPGAAQLDAEAKTRLAAQVARTLDEVSPDKILAITDGGTAVPIPETGGGPEFTMTDFTDFYGPPTPDADVYFLRQGKIVGEDGDALKGPVNSGDFLNSIALSRPGGGDTLAVAAVSGTGSGAALEVGTQSDGLRRTSVHGVLSRPAWVPGQREVWIGTGGKIFRLPVKGRSAKAAEVLIPSTTGGGRIVALRFSPEGSRVALVIATNASKQQLFLGSIVRTTGQVRVDALQAVSPEKVVITDLAWIGETKLFALGYNAASSDAHIYETNSDGSFWSARGLGSLPDPPDSVTAAVGQLAWVSVNATVWKQDRRSWTSAVASSGQTLGTDPVYLE